MKIFGAGLTWATPLQDAGGTAITTPTPVMFGVTQEVEIDFKFDLKEMYGNLQFPVAIGRGKGSVSGKINSGEIFAGALETVLFGQAGAGGLSAARYDTVGTLVAASVTVAAPLNGTFDGDLGVIMADTGLPLTRTNATTVSAGQYKVDTTGVYTFNTAEVGRTAFINFRYTATAGNAVGSRSITLKSLPMGYAPTFMLDQYIDYMGKKALFRLFNCVAEGTKFQMKNDDFSYGDMGFKCFANSAGNIGSISLIS